MVLALKVHEQLGLSFSDKTDCEIFSPSRLLKISTPYNAPSKKTKFSWRRTKLSFVRRLQSLRLRNHKFPKSLSISIIVLFVQKWHEKRRIYSGSKLLRRGHDMEDLQPMAAEELKIFEARLQLQGETRIDLDVLKRLQSISQENWDVILQEFQLGMTLTNVAKFLQVFEIEIDRKALARFLRRTQPVYLQTETDRRSKRVSKRLDAMCEKLDFCGSSVSSLSDLNTSSLDGSGVATMGVPQP